MTNNDKKISIGYAICGSFCTFEKSFNAAKKLIGANYDLTPIMSFNAKNISTRFGEADEWVEKFETLTKKSILSTIEDVEPIGPNKSFDLLVISPCTSNTLAKLALGITDTPVTMAVKSHVRNNRPVLIALSTNDALSASAKNIGTLLNYKNYYFLPYSQDDYKAKPASMVAQFDLIIDAVKYALNNVQIQPILSK